MSRNQLTKQTIVAAVSFVAVAMMTLAVPTPSAKAAMMIESTGHDHGDTHASAQKTKAPTARAHTTASDDDNVDDDEASASEGVDCFYAANADDPTCRDTDTKRAHVKHAASH